MDSEKIKNFLILYFSIIMPALLFLLAVLGSANVVIFFLLIIWFGAGLLIVFLPSSPEIANQ